MNRLFELTERYVNIRVGDDGKSHVLINLQKMEEHLYELSQDEGDDYNIAPALINQHIEKNMLKWYLAKSKGNITDTALAIGWSRGKTTNRIKQFKLHNYGRKQDD